MFDLIDFNEPNLDIGLSKDVEFADTFYYGSFSLFTCLEYNFFAAEWGNSTQICTSRDMDEKLKIIHDMMGNPWNPSYLYKHQLKPLQNKKGRKNF